MFDQLEISQTFFENWLVLRMLGIRDCVPLKLRRSIITFITIKHHLNGGGLRLDVQYMYCISSASKEEWCKYLSV